MTIALDTLTAESFEPLLGATFEIGSAGAALTLTEIKRLGAALRDGGAFALYFEGPGPAPLQQAIYPIRHPALGTLDIFIVPVGRTADGFRYEAIFT
jgi:hypothetical protein